MEGEGQRVAWLRQTGALTPTWRGVDSCSVTGPTRVYVGIDGFLAPMVTEAEKQKRRAARVRRRRQGRRGARLRNYVGERTSMIRYAENRARGWDIGSGPTESLCNTNLTTNV